MTIANFGPYPASVTPQWLIRDHPLCRDLVFWCFPGLLDAVDLVTGARPWSRSGVYQVQSQYGTASFVSQGTGHGLAYPWRRLVSPSTAHNTVVALAKPSSVSRSTAITRLNIEPSNTCLVDFNLNSDRGGGPSAGIFGYRNYSTTAEYRVQSKAGVGPDGAWHLWGGSRVQANPTGVVTGLYIDGVGGTTILDTGSGIDGSGATNMVSPHPISICGHTGGDIACDYPVVFVAIWNRTLSDAEQFTLSIDPWQVLAAPRLWFLTALSAPAAGGFSGTPGVASLVKTGQTPALTQTKNFVGTPGVASLTKAGFVPVLTTGGSFSGIPGLANLIKAGGIPILIQTQPFVPVISVGSGSGGGGGKVPEIDEFPLWKEIRRRMARGETLANALHNTVEEREETSEPEVKYVIREVVRYVDSRPEEAPIVLPSLTEFLQRTAAIEEDDEEILLILAHIL